VGLKSCLYETHIMHCRIRPVRHQFMHKIFMFYFNLDEMDALTQRLFLLSHNRANVYSFRDDDHFKRDGLGIKEKVLAFLKEKGLQLDGGTIMLLTNVRTFGYLFNPVSFYFCFDLQGNPVCVVPEIGNTFKEIKPFFIGPKDMREGQFVSQQKKYFYISPFVKLDMPMDFQLSVPDQTLNIKIDDFDEQGKFLYTVMSGKSKALTNSQLFWMTLKYPLVTLKVIVLIHWHALMLWFKKVPFEEKTSNLDLQKEVYRGTNTGNKMS
jgi:DUF1365 family protein